MGMMTGAAFIDLYAAYDAVNHSILMIQTLYNTTYDSTLCSLPEHAVQLKIVCGAAQRAKLMEKSENGVPQASVLSPLLFNIYTNDQPLHDETHNFIYSDDFGLTSQHNNNCNKNNNIPSKSNIKCI